LQVSTAGLQIHRMVLAQCSVTCLEKGHVYSRSNNRQLIDAQTDDRLSVAVLRMSQRCEQLTGHTWKSFFETEMLEEIYAMFVVLCSRFRFRKMTAASGE